MKKTRFIRALALILSALMLCGGLGISVSAVSSSSALTSDSESLRDMLNASSYSTYNLKWPSTKGSAEVIVDALDAYYYTDGTTTYYYDADVDGYYYYNEQGLRVEAEAEEVPSPDAPSSRLIPLKTRQ